MIRVGSVAGLASLSLLVASCGEEAAAPPAPLVYTALVGPSAAARLRLTGVVRARTESALGFRVSGKIVERLVDPGDRVRKGQALMRVDRADYALALGSARAAAEAARAQMVKATGDERRSRTLATAGWVSPAGYEQARALADAARAQFDAAQAQADQIANQLAYSELQADADGVVTEVPGEPGQVVAAGQPVLRLARDGAREAEVFLPEGRQGAATGEASARLYADRDRVFPATLRELAAAADPATRTYRARYVLDGGEAAPLGATVTVELGSALRGSGSTRDVPLGALFDSGEGTAVWTVDPETSRVSARSVTVARLAEERAEIQSGLEEGDRIVALGAHLLKPGQRVRVATAPLAGLTP